MPVTRARLPRAPREPGTIGASAEFSEHEQILAKGRSIGGVGCHSHGVFGSAGGALVGWFAR